MSEQTHNPEINTNEEFETARAAALVEAAYTFMALREFTTLAAEGTNDEYGLLKKGKYEGINVEDANAGRALIGLRGAMAGNVAALAPVDDYDHLNDHLATTHDVLTEVGIIDPTTGELTAPMGAVVGTALEMGKGFYNHQPERATDALRDVNRSPAFNTTLHKGMQAAKRLWKEKGMGDSESISGEHFVAQLDELENRAPDYADDSRDVENIVAPEDWETIQEPAYDALIGEGENAAALALLQADLRALHAEMTAAE